MKRIFPVGVPVKGANLIGREDEINKIIALLKML